MKLGEQKTQVSRQVYRRLMFLQHFKSVCRKFGGGLNWTGKDCLPRKNRRKIAQAMAKAEIRKGRTKWAEK